MQERIAASLHEVVAAPMVIEGQQHRRDAEHRCGPGAPGRTPMWRCAGRRRPVPGQRQGRPAPLSTIRPGRAEDRFPGARSAASGYPFDMLQSVAPFPPIAVATTVLAPAVAHQTPCGCAGRVRTQRLPGSLKTTVKTFGEPKKVVTPKLP